ncbi:DUF2125 domain-containing protein [Mesobacterium sp. TK19101]|uniref:DUF2125 domain-containing protein n=1 Tax=Mesobacterium hydrothermale TaxID=3111907 RepID=A0ABU6HJY3_9RHOB|nr:DUF2125 domain-containing protein [Mesobacterium sp. TK19101]MEC3862755.1 DUF2125 domain-containing protein [Mesobacterium sp. TK19101]
MKQLIAAILVAALGWAGYWGWQAHSLNSATEAWFDARRADGWEASHDSYALRGFPSRLDQTFAGLTLADPETGMVWQAALVEILRLSYKPNHLILAFGDNQSLTASGQTWDIGSDGLRASVVTGAADALVRVNAEAEVLNIASSRGKAVALAGLTAAFLKQDGSEYRLAVQATGLATEGAPVSGAALPDSFNGLRADMVIGFDRSWTTGTVTGPRPQPRHIALRLAEYRYGELQLKLAGDLTVDSRGLLDGSLTLKAENWREILRAAVEQGYLPQGLGDALEQGLGLAAQLNGNPRTLDLPLNFAGGRVSLGPIPLGMAPRIILP